MRKTLSVVALVTVLCLAAGPLLAQGEFKLRFREAGGKAQLSPILRSAQQYVHAPKQPASQLRGLPKKLSGTVNYAQVTLGGRTVVMAAAVGSATNLYVDTDLDGSLADEKPIKAKAAGGYQNYGPIVLTVGTGSDKRKVPLLVRRRQGMADYFLCFPGGYREGAVKLGGRKYLMGIVDINMDGRIKSSELSMRTLQSRQCDGFALDLDGNGQLSSSMASYEILPYLPRIIKVNSAWYAVTVKEDGSAVTFQKADPEFGTIDAGSPDAELMLFSDTGYHRLSGSGGRWNVPEGTYLPIRITLAKQDRAGVKWSITGRPSGARQLIKLEEGKTAELKLGGQLVTKTDARKTGSGQTYSIGLSLEGPGGVSFGPGVMKGSKRQPAPKFEIVNRKGKVLKSDKFSYG